MNLSPESFLGKKKQDDPHSESLDLTRIPSSTSCAIVALASASLL
jgi:hypothetical protein